jgi:two-component system KDP operon response regulator KdpE
MSAGKILVVDDDPQIRRVMKATLVGHGYEVVEARTGEEALEKLSGEMLNLVLLDLNMSGIGGLETCRALCSGSDIPVIILSVRNSEKDKVAALDAGANDYVTKPFSIEELLARIRAALRRSSFSSENGPHAFTSPELEVDFETRHVSAHGAAVRLTPKEFELLRHLAGVYCERSKNTHADPLSSGTCRNLCRITHPEWGNTRREDYSTSYAVGRAAFADFGVIWVWPFAVNSR